MDKKNIAIILPKLSGGGAERVGAAVSQHLAKKHNVFLIIYDDNHIVYPHGGKVLPLHIKGTYNPFLKVVNIIRRIHAIKKIKREKQIDISFSFLETTNFVNIFTRHKEKVIISVRNYTSRSLSGFYGFLYKLMIKIFYHKASKIIVVSKAAAKDLVDNFGIDSDIIKVIYNPYNLERIHKLSLELLPTGESEIFKKEVLINVGRIHPQKGQDILIQSFHQLLLRHPECQLVFLGAIDGNKKYLSKLRNMCQSYGLTEKVHFLGFKANPFKYLSKATLFVFPSRYEGFPNGLCEAMICGSPVISSDCLSGPREILAPELGLNDSIQYPYESEYGILAGSSMDLERNPEKLASAIDELLRNGEKRIKMKNKSLFRVKQFQEKEIMRDYESFI